MLTDAHFLAVAYIVADAGTCSRLKVGAVLIRDRRIISTGYNGAPADMSHCTHPQDDEFFHGDLDSRDGCIIAVHAEVNAIAFAAKHGVSTEGSILYTTDSPCMTCAQLIINAGIKEVKYGKEYRDSSGINLLWEAGLGTEELGEPEVQLVSITSGHRSGVYPGKHARSESIQEFFTSQAHRRGRGSRI